jgi:hypothetical protein
MRLASFDNVPGQTKTMEDKSVATFHSCELQKASCEHTAANSRHLSGATFLRLGLGLCLAITLVITSSLPAHHAFSAEFDANLPIAVSGKVLKVDWINPHAWVHVETTLEDGSKQVWELEAGTPNTLVRRGLTRTLLTPGMEVVVRGYQSKDQLCTPSCKGSGRDITFADGRNIFMGSSGTGAPTDGADPKERRPPVRHRQ